MPTVTCTAVGGIMIGKTISHYRIIEKLGGGGMGVVCDKFVSYFLKCKPRPLDAWSLVKAASL